MATLDLTRRPPLAEVVSGRVAAVAAVTGLVGLSLLLRATQLHAGFWIDEGISVGVAHHHWTSIPHLLRQDGSPPSYYMLLGIWIRVFGDGEAATHTLSLVFALALSRSRTSRRGRVRPPPGSSAASSRRSTRT